MGDDYGVILWCVFPQRHEFFTFKTSDGLIITRPMPEIVRMKNVLTISNVSHLETWLKEPAIRRMNRHIGFTEELARDVCGFEGFIRI